MKNALILLFLLLLPVSFLSAQVSESEVLLTISEEPVLASEFIRVYNKNLNLVQDDSQKEVESYLELFINYKLKLAEARSLRYDKDPIYLKELKSYKNQLTQNYLTDKNVTDDLVLEAYDRTLNEVKAQHILVRIEEFETDTLQAYTQIQALQGRLINEDFESLKKEIHDGKSVFVEDLGFFTAFKMLYNFETAAFSTKVGEVSNPFRTKYGFHVVKVLQKRKSKGQVSVAHIMIANTQKDTTLVAKDRIQELHRLLLQGENFGSLAKQFSDDKSSSMRNGELKPFKSGQINSATFESTAFNLKEKGDISEPIQTQFGWHILKLIDKKAVEEFDKLKSDLESQVRKDSRSQLVKAKMLDKLLSEYQLTGVNPNLLLLQDNVTYDSSNKTWGLSNQIIESKPFLTIQNKSYSFSDFIDFVNKNKKSINKNWSIEFSIDKQYKLFLEQSVFQYKKDNLENENQDFANILNEYREGLLLFELMQDKIWEGAKNDSIGLNAFYSTNKENYVWPERVVGSVARSSNAKNIKKVRKLWSKNKSNQEIDELLNKRKQNVMFSNGEFELGKSPLPESFTFRDKSTISKVIKENNSFFSVNAKELKPQSQKTLEEAKGQLISDYQTKLEAQWVLELKSKFEVKVNKDVLQKVNTIISK
jgi:peptidyl-prolyl cis-trans isomerase SurA|tara:strand:- start:398 stop:2344 length:1947 start_codon:yes stop_codon:yes gene_type:complete